MFLYCACEWRPASSHSFRERPFEFKTSCYPFKTSCYSYGLCSYGPYSSGPDSYGPCSYGRSSSKPPALSETASAPTFPSPGTEERSSDEPERAAPLRPLPVARAAAHSLKGAPVGGLQKQTNNRSGLLDSDEEVKLAFEALHLTLDDEAKAA